MEWNNVWWCDLQALTCVTYDYSQYYLLLWKRQWPCDNVAIMLGSSMLLPIILMGGSQALCGRGGNMYSVYCECHATYIDTAAHLVLYVVCCIPVANVVTILHCEGEAPASPVCLCLLYAWKWLEESPHATELTWWSWQPNGVTIWEVSSEQWRLLLADKPFSIDWEGEWRVLSSVVFIIVERKCPIIPLVSRLWPDLTLMGRLWKPQSRQSNRHCEAEEGIVISVYSDGLCVCPYSSSEEYKPFPIMLNGKLWVVMNIWWKEYWPPLFPDDLPCCWATSFFMFFLIPEGMISIQVEQYMWWRVCLLLCCIR